MTSRTAVVDICIQFLLAILFVTVQADPLNNGPQSFQHQSPQYAQNYKEVIMYLTPTQIRDYEAGQGLPNFVQVAPSAYQQQNQEHQIPINAQEGQNQVNQNTLDILEANKIRFQNQQADLEYSKAQEHNIDVRPIEEPNTEAPLLHPQVSIAPKAHEHHEQEHNKLVEQSNKEQEQIAKSYAYVHLFANQKQENTNKIQLFHPEPHNVHLNEELNIQKERNIGIQQDSLLPQKFKLVPYQYAPGENQQIHQLIQNHLGKQQENKVHQQLFIPAPPQQDSNDRQNLLNFPQQNAPQQYAPQYSSNNRNENLEKILQEIQLEREAARIHVENIAKSPAVVVRKEISIVRRRPVEVIKHINIPYPAPFLVPVPSPVEVKIPQPYAVPVEIVRRIPVPVIKTEAVEVEKPVPYEVEKHVAEIVEKKVLVPVDKPYTVERIVPVEVRKTVPVPISVSRPEKFTIIRHVWKH